MQPLIDLFERYAEQLPLELFIFLGSFIEELISPIPSFVVLVPGGVVAQAQQVPLWYLLVLAVLAGFGRIGGAIILYWIADKLEDKILTNGRTFLGITHRQIEAFGKQLSKNKQREWLVLFLMNAIPIFPVAALSLSCGFVKVRKSVFVLTTFFGSIVNAVIYLCIGYGGYRVAETVQDIERASQIIIAALAIAIIVWLTRRTRAKHAK